MPQIVLKPKITCFFADFYQMRFAIIICAIVCLHQVALARHVGGFETTTAADVPASAHGGQRAPKKGPVLPGGQSDGSRNATSRMSVAEMIGYGLRGALEHWNGACHYGYNCGAKCGPGTDSYYYEWDSTMKYWDDALDKYCWMHDWCLHNHEYTSKSKRIACDKTLEGRARGIYNAYKECSWYAIWCAENDYAANAWLVMKGMEAMRVFNKRG